MVIRTALATLNNVVDDQPATGAAIWRWAVVGGASVANGAHSLLAAWRPLGA
jgi:hypothetical protein